MHQRQTVRWSWNVPFNGAYRRSWSAISCGAILVSVAFVAGFLPTISMGFPRHEPLHQFRNPYSTGILNHVMPPEARQFRQYGFGYDHFNNIHVLGQGHKYDSESVHPRPPIQTHTSQPYPPIDPEAISVLYQTEYSHSGSPPPFHPPMLAHGPIPRPGPPHHYDTPAASLPKLQFIHFMNPVPISANKFSYTHNLRRDSHIGLAPHPYPVGFHAPGFMDWIHNLVLRIYCAFNAMNSHCLQFYGEYEDWFGGEPFYDRKL